ncbi:MAG TPA: inositol monophosphatase family protein [Candidatus Dormibacteraeota bacterium]|nr:inositol monophosphatase family protein [Candidatus Dormibacteraeota bacterium]
MAAAVAVAVRGYVGTERGRESLSIGAGGDRTAMVDRVAEDAVLSACARLAGDGARFLLRSEEAGDRAFGAAQPVLLVDPVDGSINAKQGLPYHCTSLALVDGTTFGDLAVGVVRNLAGDGVFSAVRGGGVLLDGAPMQPLDVALQNGRIPVLLLEAAAQPARVVEQVELLRHAGRLRLMGAAALSLCQVARGAATALVSTGGMRSFDCAAGLLVLRESGAVVTDANGDDVMDVPADFSSRVRLVASRNAEVHQTVLSLLNRSNVA